MPGILASFGLNIAPFERSLNDSKVAAKQTGHELADTFGNKIAGSMGTSLTALAGPLGIVTAAITVFGSALKNNFSLQEKAHEIELGSERLQVTASRFIDLTRNAERSGASIETVYAAFRKLAQGTIQAENGNKEMIASLSAFGLSVDQVKGKNVDEIFSAISKNAAGAELTIDRVAALMKLMGRGADELLPGLKSGAFNVEDIFKPSDATIKRRSESFKDLKAVMGEAKSFGSWFFSGENPLLAYPSNLLDAGLGKVGKAIRRMHGQYDDEAHPIDLKTLSASDLRAQEAAEKDKEKQAKHLQTLEDQLADKKRKNAMEDLTTAGKIVELKKQEEELKRKITTSGAGGIFAELKGEKDTSAENKVKLEMELEDRKHERIRLEKQQMSEEERDEKKKEKDSLRSNRFHAPEVNALQRIGAYVSPLETAILTESQKHGQTLTRIEKHLDHIDRTQSRGQF
jgi:hypothetical protein